MRIRILGEVRILGGSGDAVKLERVQERCLLAALAIEVGQRVEVATLVECAWPEGAPKDVDGTLGRYLSSVRVAIEAAGGERSWLRNIRPRAYLLDVNPEAIDYHRFGKSLEEARRQAASGRLETAIGTYREALAQWTGDPLADVPENSVKYQRFALEQLRHDVACELLELQLRVGDFTSVALEAARLVGRIMPTDRLVDIGLWGLAKSGQHTKINDFMVYVRQRMWESADAAPRASVEAAAKALTANPDTPLRLPGPVTAATLGRPIDPGLRPATAVGEVPPDPQRLAEGGPYPGLAAFGEQQADRFFGRKRVTGELVDLAIGRLGRGGLMALVASSGTGKSSLLGAGLLPAIADGALPVAGSRGWPRLLFTPTAAPVRELAARIADLGGLDAAELHDLLLDDPGSFPAILREARPGTGPARVVMVVDQFEEVFSLCADEHQRKVFVRALSAAAEPVDGHEPALVVLGLRADFYGRCSAYPELVETLRRRQIFLGAMDAAEVREAIEKPASLVGLELEPELTDTLLLDLGIHDSGSPGEAYDPGRLPFLSHSLLATWLRSDGRTLTVRGYLETGGIRRAIATTADNTYRDFDPPTAEVARRLLLRLVQIGDGTDDARRRVDRVRLLASSGAPDIARFVLHEFAAVRLLTLNESTVEITHDSLLHAWPELRRWLDDDREDNLAWQHLEEASANWDGRDHGALLSGTRLAVVRAWASEHANEVSVQAGAFLAESIRQEARTRRFRRRMITALSVVALLAVVAAAVAFVQGRAAVTERDDAVLRRVSLEVARLRGTDPVLAAKLAVAAYRQNPAGSALDTDVYTGLVDGSAVHLTTPATGATVALSRDGRLLAFGHHSGSVDLWDVTNSGAPRHLTPSPIDCGSFDDGDTSAMEFGADGHTLVTGRFKGVFCLWDVHDPARPRLLSTVHWGSDFLSSLAINATGRKLVVAGWNDDHGGGEDKAQLFDLADPAHPAPESRIPSSEGIATVAFSPEDDTIAGGGPTRPAVLWDVYDSAHPMLLPPPKATSLGTSSVAFSDDGNLLAEADQNSVRLWDLSHPEGRRRLGVTNGHISPVAAVAFGSAAGLLATGDNDGTLRLWNIANPDRPAPLGSIAAHVASMTFSVDGRILVTGPDGFGPTLWHLDPAEAARLICTGKGPLDQTDWARYFPYSPYRNSC